METFSARRILPLLIRLSAVVAIAVPLSGCFLPPMLSLATTSANIITWAATGKTATDHAYSAVARSDCSSMRIFENKPICIDPTAAGGTAVAAETTDAPATVAVASNPPDTTSAAPDAPRHAYVAIGSFHDLANAERSQTQFADYHASIVSATVNGQHFNRVVAGPLTEREAAALKNRITAAAKPVHRAG